MKKSKGKAKVSAARKRAKPASIKRKTIIRPKFKKARKRVAIGRSQGRALGTRKRASISKQIERSNASARAVGEENLRKGARTIAKTGNLTPTKQGFASLSKSLVSVLRGQRNIRGKERLAYSFSLSTRFRGPDGSFMESAPITGGFPSRKAIRNHIRENAKRGKKETEAQAFRRIVELSIIRAVFRPVDGDVIGQSYRDLKAGLVGKSAKEVRAAISTFKKQRGMTFTVTVRKET